MDPLADVFDLSRVSGAVMAQLIAYEPWGLAVDSVSGAVFHAVVAGSCWLRMPGRAPQHLMPGDVVLLPTNTPHELVSSVDDEDTARELIAKHGLTFPVGHSADAAAIREATGAFVNADPVHLQSTGFVLDPDGNVIVSVYSSGAIGRLVPEDVAGLVNYVKSQQPA